MTFINGKSTINIRYSATSIDNQCEIDGYNGKWLKYNQPKCNFE